MDKKAYLVTLIRHSNLPDSGVACINKVSTHFEYSETGARDRLAAFKLANQPDKPSYVPSYEDSVRGTLRILDSKAEPAEDGKAVYRDSLTGLFYGQLEKVEIDSEELQESEIDYTVEVNVTRMYTVTAYITAESEDDAYEKACEAIRDGDYEDDMSCPEDEDFDMNDCYES